MDDIELAIITAWERVKQNVLSNPAELRHRLDRMKRRNLSQVPRIWTYALRAGDTRLKSPLVEVTPAGADQRTAGGACGRHEITVHRKALLELGRPVDVAGCTLKEAADRLGVNPQNLVPGRIKGTFDVRYVEGLEGRWGKPRPILTAKKWLDPTIRGFDSTEAAWRWTGQFDATRIPVIEQTISRVPHYQRRGPSYRDTRGLHPEHPEVTGEKAKPWKSKRLPKPPPDSVWYKWKGDQYVGYDWRNPRQKELFERHERAKAKQRAAKKLRRQLHPPPSQAKGSLTFKGWRWLCPRCGRAVQVLHLPLPPINLVANNDPEARTALAAAGADPDPPPESFACARCHRVRVLSRASKDFWNDLIAHLSGGLLYGAEVKRLAWLTRQRRRPYAPRPNAPPAHRRFMVQERLLKGWSYKRIAADMGITTGTVDTHVQAIYAQHRVHGRAELIRQMGATPEVQLTHWRDRRAVEKMTR